MGLHKYTPEEIQFLRDNIAGRTYAEMTDMFNRRFGLSLNKAQIKNALRVRKLHNNLHTVPVGTETRDFCGLIKVKIANNKWKRKHILTWEAANGPVLKGYMIAFADGNRSNYALDNLLLVSRAELAVMNTQGLFLKDKDLTKTGRAVARLILAICDREREIGKRRKKRERRRKRNEQDSGQTRAGPQRR
jgi:hypothetical protein